MCSSDLEELYGEKNSDVSYTLPWYIKKEKTFYRMKYIDEENSELEKVISLEDLRKNLGETKYTEFVTKYNFDV